MRTRFPLLGLVLACCLLGACSGNDDESALRANLDAMEAAIEAQSPRDFMDYVADDFRAESEAMNKEQLRAYLLGIRFRNPNIQITLGPAEIQLFDDRATVRVTVFVAGGAGLLPERAEQVTVLSHWQKVDGDWLCFDADWER